MASRQKMTKFRFWGIFLTFGIIFGFFLTDSKNVKFLRSTDSKQQIQQYDNSKHQTEQRNLPGVTTHSISRQDQRAVTQNSSSVISGTKPSPANKLRVVILAYMHTGSTFTGSVLQRLPGTFYEYEPIRENMYRTYTGLQNTFMNGTSLLVTKQNFTNFEAEMLRHRFQCHHGRLDMASLANLYHPIQSLVNRDRSQFMQCQGHGVAKVNYVTYDKESIAKCLPLLTGNCERADKLIHKYIRADLNITERLLDSFPKLKVVHLLRDPRAMMDSQHRKNDMKSKIFSFFRENTKRICDRMLDDLRLYHRIKNKYGERIMIVRHEDLSDNPVYVFENIFDFLGVRMPKIILLSLKALTARIPTWRKHIDELHLKTVDELCGDIYPRLGYIRLPKISHVRNLDVPAYVAMNLSNLENLVLRQSI